MPQLTDRTLTLLLQQKRLLLDAGITMKIALNLSAVVLRDSTLRGRIEEGLYAARVPAALTSSVDATIVAAVISLGHELGMVVTAEGVEQAEQAVRLAVLGCDRLQGFHFACARPADEIVDLLSRSDAPG